jgi:hypothetical protein
MFTCGQINILRDQISSLGRLDGIKRSAWRDWDYGGDMPPLEETRNRRATTSQQPGLCYEW